MSKYLIIGKAFSKGVSDVGGTTSKGIRATRTLADGTKITTSVVKITRKALKGNGEVGAKTVVVLKAKLKDIKSLIKKKKRKGKSASDQDRIKEDWQSQFDVYDEWEWLAEDIFKHSSNTKNYFISQNKPVEKVNKSIESIESIEKKSLDANDVIGRDLINKPTLDLPNQASRLDEKSKIVLPKRNIDFTS